MSFNYLNVDYEKRILNIIRVISYSFFKRNAPLTFAAYGFRSDRYSNVTLMKAYWSNFYSRVSHYFADSYSDRHQTTHYPLYYSEQQDQCRESSYWTLPGSRAVGSLPTYANWTDQNLAGQPSSHFPFILDTQPQHQHHMGQYQLHEGRDREWTAAQRASREYDRGFLREGWQRRWESCSPIRYNNREAPSKRNDNSYRELEAWAARYSHSLPRRRRIEAEMRGASQGFVDSSRSMERDYRSGTDPRLVALQQVIQSNSNVKAAGLWTKAGRQQGSIHHPSQTPATDTGHMLNLKDHSISQRKVFSQPPGYVAPPPYGSPQKSLQMLQHDISEKYIGQQSYGPHNTGKMRDTSESYGKEEKENLTKPDGNQHTFPKTEGQKHLKKETESLQGSTAVSVQESNIQFEGMLSLQLPRLLYSTSSQSNELSPKVIEGRKFRLNKKKGGLTIFCLVSRIADTSENLASSSYSQTFQSTEKNSATVQSSSLDETHKLADEVDFIVPALREQSKDSTGINAVNQEATIGECLQGDLPEDYSSNKTDTIFMPKEQENDADCSMERQVTHSEQSSSVKYPLWKEPSFLIRSETETLSTYPTGENEEGGTDILHNETVSTEVVSNYTKGETLEIEEVSEPEDCKCSPVVDTSCVVVKMEIISLPKKEHVHYFDSTAQQKHIPPETQTAHSAEYVPSSSQLNEDLTKGQSAEKEAACSNELPESELTFDPKQKQTIEDENGISIDDISSFSVPEKESLEGRAQRILGIPVDDCFAEQQTDNSKMPLMKDQLDEPLHALDIVSSDTEKQIITEATVEEESQVQLDDAQTKDAVHFVESENSPKKAEDESAEVLTRHQEQMSLMYEQNNDLQCDLGIHTVPETSEDPSCETERSTSLESKVFSTMSSTLLLPSPGAESLDGDISLSKFSSEIQEFDPGLMVLNQPQNGTLDHSPPSETTSPQLALPPPTTETVQSDLQDVSTSAHTNHSPEDPLLIQLHLDLINENTEMYTLKDQEEKGQSIHMRDSETSDAHICITKDETEEAASKQHFEEFVNGCCMKEMYVAPEEKAKESQGDQMTKEILEMSQKNTTEVNILYQQNNEQQCFCVEERSLNDKREIDENSAEQMETSPTEKQALPQQETFPQSSNNHAGNSQQPEKMKSVAGTMEQSAPQEETVSKVNILHEKHINDQKDKACAVQTCITEDHLKNGASNDSSTQLKEPILKQTATDSQSPEKIENLQDIDFQPSSIPTSTLPSDLDVLSCEILSLDTDTKETEIEDGAGSLAITESVLCQHHIVTEESLKLLPSSSSDSPPSLVPLHSVEGEGVQSESINCLLEGQSQYPKSLWDAVSRIRKHTAPDSENEEEEVSEPWDPESVGEDATCSLPAQDLYLKWRDVVGERAEGVDGEEVGDVQLLEHGREDTLSYSSTSSHGSEDTVVIAAVEEELVDTLPNCASATTANERDSKEVQCCLSEVKDDNAADKER